MKWTLQEKNERYYALGSYKENGKWKRKWISTGFEVKNNKRKALEFMEKLKEQYEEDDLTLQNGFGGEVLFTDFMKEWLKLTKPSIRENTYHAYKLTVERHIVPYFTEHNVKLRELNHIGLQNYYNYKLQTISGNTIRKHHANIHKALDYAMKTGAIKRNPADFITLPKKQKYKAKFYNAEQLGKLLEVVKESTIEIPVFLTAYYGLRRSEVLGLKWGAVDFESNVIRIEHTAVLVGGTTTYVDDTKSASSFRVLPLIPIVKEHLLKLKKQQKKDKRLFGDSYYESDYICRWQDGELLKPKYVSDKFRETLKKNNMEPIRFHDLRHSAASLLIHLGFSLKDIQEWLGHSDIATTGYIYTHLWFDVKVEMGDGLQQIMNQ